MDLFKKLKDWVGLGEKPKQPNFKAEELARQQKVATSMPKILSPQGQQDYMKKNAPLSIPKPASIQAPTLTISNPSVPVVKQPAPTPAPKINVKPITPVAAPVQKPASVPVMQTTNKPTAPSAVPLLQTTTKPSAPIGMQPSASSVEQSRINNQARIAQENKTKNDAAAARKESASFIDKQYQKNDGSVVKGRDLPLTTFKFSNGNGKTYGNVLDSYDNMSRTDQDNYIKDLDKTIAQNAKDFGDKNTAARRDEANIVKTILQERGRQKQADVVSSVKSFVRDTADTMLRDTRAFGQVTNEVIATAGGGRGNAQDRADVLQKRLDRKEISREEYAKQMNQEYNANEGIVGDGEDKGTLDRVLRLSGNLANTVGSVMPLRSLSSGVAKTTIGMSGKEAAKEYSKELIDNAVVSGMGAFQETGIDTKPVDVATQAALGGIIGAGGRVAGDVAGASIRALNERANPGAAVNNILASNPNLREQAISDAETRTREAGGVTGAVDPLVSKKAPITPEERTATVQGGIITPATKDLPLSERVATAINHKAATEAVAPAATETPDFGETIAEQAGRTAFDNPNYIDQNNPSNIPQGLLDEAEAQRYYDNQPIGEDGLPIPSYLRDNESARMNNEVQPNFLVKDPLMEQSLLERNEQFFGDGNVSMPSQLSTNLGEELLGRYQNGNIDVRAGQSSPENTYFHEAVHRAIAEYTTPGERKVLFDETLEKYGKDTLLAEAQKSGYTRGINEAIEERISNDFIDFVAKRSESATFSQRVQGIFEDLIARIQRAFNTGKLTDQFMNDLFGGSFARREPTTRPETGIQHPAIRELDQAYADLQKRFDVTENESSRRGINEAMAANRGERRLIDQEPRYLRDESDPEFTQVLDEKDIVPNTEPWTDSQKNSAREELVRSIDESDLTREDKADVLERVPTDEKPEIEETAERKNFKKGQENAQLAFEKMEADPAIQKRKAQEGRERQVDEAIERGFNDGPRHTVDKIVDSAAELGFVSKSRVEAKVAKYAEDNGYDISAGRAFKNVREEVGSLADESGKIKPIDEIQPSDTVLQRIKKPGIKNALPYGTEDPSDMVRQMVYKNEDGTAGHYFEYRNPDGRWQKSGLDAVDIKSPQTGVKLEKLKADPEINKEAKRAYETGTTAQYIWRENDAGFNSEFIREFDAAMGDTSKLDKIDSNKIISYDPDKHYIEAGKVVDGSNGKILGNYIEITPEGVNMFAGRQRISLNYGELDLQKIREMKTSGITWSTEGIIDRITGNRKHTNSVDYFKRGGSKTKEALMQVMVEEPRAAQRNIMDEDNALGAAVNQWEASLNKAVKRNKRLEARRDAVYVIEPAAEPKPKAGEPKPKKTTVDERLAEYARNYGQKAADSVKGYDQFMRGVYDNLLVRMNQERLAIGQPAIKRRLNYITHIAEMADSGVLRQSIQGINNMIGGDVMIDSRGALPSSITGTTGTRKPKSKYNPFSSERLADNKPLNPFDPLRVYSNLALQNIHMTKPITMNRSIETTIRGLSEAKQEMSSSRGIQYVNEMIEDVVTKAGNGKASADELQTLSRKLFGITRVFQDIDGIQGFQKMLRYGVKDGGKINTNKVVDGESFDTLAEKISDQLAKKLEDTDMLNELKKEADGLQQFVGIIQEHTNKLAGKTNWLIRGLKDLEKGQGTDLALTIAKGVQQHAALTSIVGNANSALAQLMATPLVMGTTRPKYQLEGLKLLGDKTLMKKSDALWIRYKESALTKKGKFQKTMDVGGLPLLTIERNVMKWTFGSKYAEGIGRGLNERQAVKYAERFIGDTTSWRDVASSPRAYDRPIPASLLQFTREVTQQYRGFWNRFTPAEKATTLLAVTVVSNVMALATGAKMGADPLGAVIESGYDLAGGNDAGRDEEENNPWAKAVRAGKNMLSETISAVPMASAAANTIWSKDDRAKIFGDDSNLGKYEGNMAMFSAIGNLVRGTNNLTSGNVDQAWKDFVKVFPMGSQLQKTSSAWQALGRGYTTTSTGKVKASVDGGNPMNWVLGTLFGTNSLLENRKPTEEGTALSEKQTVWFKKLQDEQGSEASKTYLGAIDQKREDRIKDATKTLIDKSSGKDTSTNSGQSSTEDDTDLSYDEDSQVKFSEGTWKTKNGKVVDENGKIVTKFYKDRAKKNTDQKNDATYDDYALGYGLNEEAEVSATGNTTLDKMKNLENQKKASEKAGTAVSLLTNGKDEFKDIPDWVKEQFYIKNGFAKKDVEYAASATYSVDAKVEGYFKPIADSGDHKKLMDELTAGRVKGINDKYFATTAVITELYDQGYISKAEQKALKDTDLSKDGKQKASKKGGKGKAEYTSADVTKFANGGGSDNYSAIAAILKQTRSSADTPGSKKVSSSSVQVRGLRAIVNSRNKQSTKKRRLA